MSRGRRWVVSPREDRLQWIPIVLIIALLSSVSSAQEAQIVVVSDKLTLGLPGDEFGTSITGSGGSVVIGAPGYDGSTSTGDPAAYSGYAAMLEANPTGVRSYLGEFFLSTVLTL